jgi:quercetin dioxygenase-like cupin family protein
MIENSMSDDARVRILRPDRVQAPVEYFEGRGEWETVLESPDIGLLQLRVHFHDGARTRWHLHGGDQALYFVEGRGMVQEEDGPVIDCESGDMVLVPPGKIHRHGAAEGASAVHLAITAGGTVWEGDPDYPG